MNALILCGGKGERLRPLTDEIPKPMVKIKEQPILWYILKQIEVLNLNNIFIGVGYKSNVIKEYFNNNKFIHKITLIDDGDVDIIDRLKSTIILQPNEDLILLYGDTISNLDFNELIISNMKSSNFGTLTIWPLSTSFGVVDFDENLNITKFKEKPKLDVWINIGYFIIKKELFKFVNQFNKFENFLDFCANNKLLNAYKHNGDHFTINTVVELDTVEKNIHKLFKI